MYKTDIKYPWFLLRDLVSADDTALAAFSWSDWPSTGPWNAFSNIPDATHAKIMFFGSHRHIGSLQHIDTRNCSYI